ncbi:unnamed protein product, partial [Ixodes hexagonus]
MLSYLTHKLRTPELNGTSAFHTKTDDDHDSGTESDDESAEIEELQKYMEHSIQLEDGSGHSPGRRRVLYQQTRFPNRQQQQPPPHHHHHHHNHHHQQPQPQQPQQRRRHQQQQVSVNGAVVEATRKPPVPSPPVPSTLVTLLSPGGGGGVTAVVSPSPVPLDSALPSDSDHNLDPHSSEEELEVINNRAGSAEKRKWSQANQRRVRDARASLRRSRSDGAGGDTSSEDEDDRVTTSVDDVRTGDDDDDEEDDDDDEVRDLTWSRGGCAVVLNGCAAAAAAAAATVNGSLSNGVHHHHHHGRSAGAAAAAASTTTQTVTTTPGHRCVVVPPAPVEFRASPPLHVHRPYNGSPPPKVFHAAASGLTTSTSSSVSSSAHIPAFEVCAVSPRKRHRQDRGGGTAFGVFSLVDGGPVQRPCLDFEKMQQVSFSFL